MTDTAETASFVDFFRAADLVIFDAMYSLVDTMSVKADWGHSSNIASVELCQIAGARELCLFHHEPIHDDEAIERLLTETRRVEEITRTGEPRWSAPPTMVWKYVGELAGRLLSSGISA